MANEPAALVEPALIVLVTYVLHSTVCLSLAWLLAATGALKSATLREQIWRFAALVPFLSVAGQVAIQREHASWIWTLPTVQSVARVHRAQGDDRLSPPMTQSDARETIAPRVIDDTAEHVPTLAAPVVQPKITSHAMERSALPSVSDIQLAPIANHPEGSLRNDMASVPVVVQEPAILFLDEHVSSLSSAVASGGVRGQWPAMIVGVAAVWILCGVLRVVWVGVRCSLRARRFTTLTNGVAVMLVQELCHRKNISRPVRLVTSDTCSEPAAFGLRRWWTILLPPGLENRIDRSQLRAVLAHELAHLVRGDVPWLWIGRVLRASFGWQPLNLLAVRRWQEASEQLCDDWAVDGGVAPLTLAKSLTQLAELRLSKSAPTIGLPIIGRPSRLARRIQRLTEARLPDRWNTTGRRRLLTMAMIALAVAFAWSGPQIVRAVPRPEQPSHEVDTNTGPVIEPAEITESEFLPTPTAESPAIEIRPERPSSDGSLADDWNALRSDLDYAMRLLKETEADPEVSVLADRIRERVNELEVPSTEPE